jgi:hypothetical protein
MMQFLYIVAFTSLSILAVVNLVRSMMALANTEPANQRSARSNRRLLATRSFHPELLDEYGNVTSEPLLVMRSLTVDDARSRLDALYESSPGSEA